MGSLPEKYRLWTKDKAAKNFRRCDWIVRDLPIYTRFITECYLLFFLKSTAWDQNGFWGFKEWTRKPNLLCFAFLLMKLSNYIMGNKRHLPFPSSTLCVVARSNQYRPHVVSMGYRCDTVVSDEYKNAGKQTILIFWQFLHWGAKFVILNWPLWDKNWSLTWVCVLSILAPAGALLFSISQHFTSNISPNTSNIFENILLLNFTCDQVKVGKY